MLEKERHPRPVYRPIILTYKFIRWARACGCILLILSLDGMLLAQQVESEAVPGTDTPAGRSIRNEYIYNEFREGQTGARVWYYGYLGFYSLAFIGAVASAGRARLPRRDAGELFVYREMGMDDESLTYLFADGTYYMNPGLAGTYFLERQEGDRGLITAYLLDRNHQFARDFDRRKQTSIANGWLAAIGILSVYSFRPPQTYAAGELNRIENDRERLEAGEAFLERAALRAESTRGRSAYFRAAAGGLLSAAAILPFRQSADVAYARFAQTFIFNRLQSFLFPKRAIRAYENYRDNFGAEKQTGVFQNLRFESFVVYPDGVGVVFSF